MLRVFTDTGARAEVEATIAALADEAVAALAAAPVTLAAREELAALARFVSDRDF